MAGGSIPGDQLAVPHTLPLSQSPSLSLSHPSLLPFPHPSAVSFCFLLRVICFFEFQFSFSGFLFPLEFPGIPIMPAKPQWISFARDALTIYFHFIASASLSLIYLSSAFHTFPRPTPASLLFLPTPLHSSICLSLLFSPTHPLPPIPRVKKMETR